MLSRIFVRNGIIFCVSLLLLSGCWDISNKNDEAVNSNLTTEPVVMARGKIDVSGGVLTLSAQEAGIVSSTASEPGKKVSKGEVLMKLQDLRMNGEKKIAESELHIAQIKYDNLKKMTRSAQEKEKRLKVAAQVGAVQKQLSDDSAAERAQKESDLSLAAAEITVARERLNVLNERLSSLMIKAPYNGIIISTSVQPGELVNSGDRLITFLPEKPLIIRAEVNENYLDHLFVNMKARVRIDGQDSDAFESEAYLTRISPVFTTSHFGSEGQQIPARSIECILEFTHQPEMRVGQRVIVEFYRDEYGPEKF